MQNKKILLTALLGASSLSVNSYAENYKTSELKNVDRDVKASASNMKQAAFSRAAVQLASPNDFFNRGGPVKN